MACQINCKHCPNFSTGQGCPHFSYAEYNVSLEDVTFLQGLNYGSPENIEALQELLKEKAETEKRRKGWKPPDERRADEERRRKRGW